MYKHGPVKLVKHKALDTRGKQIIGFKQRGAGEINSDNEQDERLDKWNQVRDGDREKQKHLTRQRKAQGNQGSKQKHMAM